MRNIEERTIARGIGYRVYINGKNSVFFIDTGKTICHGYETLQGVAESLYYAGYIDDKNISAIGNYQPV